MQMSAHTRGLVPAISPCGKSRAQVPAFELASRESNLVAGSLVPATSPTNSNQFESLRQLPTT